MKMPYLIFFLLIGGVLTLVACAPSFAATTAPLELATVTPTDSGPSPTPTATIDWFPQEATPTPFPTTIALPTLDPLPGRGSQTVSDDFSDPSLWQFAKTASTGGNDIIISRNRLTVAINVPPSHIFSLRKDLLLKDFYAETVVDLNRCGVGDSYGMLFRAAGNEDTYRFTLGCNGQVRVERLKANTLIPLQNWLPSGDAPIAAPAKVTLGVWAAGVELRFFLNEHYQFNIIDPVFRTGTLGFFASGTSPNGMNVSFSELTISSVDFLSPTPTATLRKTSTPSRTPRP